MKRRFENVENGGMLLREARAFLKLVPWVLATLLAAFLLWRADLAARSGLFQSPPDTSPIDTASPTPTFTLEPSTPSPTNTPPPIPGLVLTPTLTVTPTLEPTATSEPTATVPELSPTPPQFVPTLTSVPPPTAAPDEAEPAPSDRDRYAEGESNLKFDWGMLFDSAALAASYAWLCCGVLLFVGVALFFLALWLAHRRRERLDP